MGNFLQVSDTRYAFFEVKPKKLTRLIIDVSNYRNTDLNLTYLEEIRRLRQQGMNDTEIRLRLGLSRDAYWEAMEEIDKLAMEEFSKKLPPSEMLAHLRQIFDESIAHLNSIAQDGTTTAFEKEEVENLKMRYVQALRDISAEERSQCKEMGSRETIERISRLFKAV